MNYRLLARYLGIVALLLGAAMVFSLLWTIPALGGSAEFEMRAFLALLGSIGIACLTGVVLFWLGKNATGRLYRREAMATVGLSWFLATFIGAVPFLLSQTHQTETQLMTVVD